MFETHWSKAAVVHPYCPLKSARVLKEFSPLFLPKLIKPDSLVTGFKHGRFTKLPQGLYDAVTP